MYKLSDIKVTLLNPEEVKGFIKNHGEIACVCYNTNEKYADKVGYSCLLEGHTSGSRGDFFKFEIECPRFTADQIVRHEIGVFKNMQSQRYVDMKDIDIYVPPQIMQDPDLLRLYQIFEDDCAQLYSMVQRFMEDKGMTGEEANDLMRTMLPIGVKTKLRIGFDIEALTHFMHKRLCARADNPIREVAKLMREQVLAVEPRYRRILVPQCVEMMYCPEKHGCGRFMSRDEVESILYRNME